MLHPSRAHAAAGSAVWVMVLALLAYAVLQAVGAQTFEPVTFASSAVALKRLYVYGGITNLSSLSSYTAQHMSVSLKSSFKCSNPPWEVEPAAEKSAFAPSLADSDGTIIVASGRNDSGLAPVALFDGEKREWRQAPFIPGEELQSKNPPRNSPGMVYDNTLKNIVLFGGSNGDVSNEINYFDPQDLTWKLSGSLTGVPGLYAPIMHYIHQLESILIMGGCTSINSSTGLPTQCADFTSAYLVPSKAAAEATKTSSIPVTKVNLTGPNGFPAPRFMPCTITLGQDAIFMHGGGNPDKALADSWILNPDTWVWSKRPISGVPPQGIMGHTCEYGFREQILVVGGHQGTEFVKTPISVILMKDWSWKSEFLGSKAISEPVKVGLGISIAIVMGAIIAGLIIKRRRDVARRSQEGERRDSEAGNTSDHRHHESDHRTKRRKDSHSKHGHSDRHGRHGKNGSRTTRSGTEKPHDIGDAKADGFKHDQQKQKQQQKQQQQGCASLSTSPASLYSTDTSPFSDKYKERSPSSSITLQDTPRQKQ
ncbi:hypothetical protein BGW42_001198 [Actinomortierella wolfii]|nr:hypothetical protein BGW42_001198 [Actinomortierella wolfii]